MSLISAHNEWDPLEEVIIGTTAGARFPTPDISLHAINYAASDEIRKMPAGEYPSPVLEETEQELQRLCDELTKLGVTVRRPEPRDKTAVHSTGAWSASGGYDYCPRDVLLTVGDMIIETPMVLRSRLLEPFAYKDLLLEYSDSGSRWISAPKPQLHDEMYDVTAPSGNRLRDLEPAFDAANVLRFGTDILYLVSDSGNERGARWLQSVLGDTYTVHRCSGLYGSTHVDSTIVPLQPGLVLINPTRVNDQNFPGFLRGWGQIPCPELVDIGYTGDQPACSQWIGMNLLVIRPGLVVVDERQLELIKVLEKYGIDVLPLRLSHARTLSGGFHCVSLDVRRTGVLETYR